MKVGVPTEIKTDEYRVALTPSGAGGRWMLLGGVPGVAAGKVMVGDQSLRYTPPEEALGAPAAG